ncbi:MAG: DUF2244 domain-containing protein [Defluviimonas sp.]|uniref:DUF2244 domain-containing protein n=1 Tax=Albidovulum sp. TaxID=1872424 RepID=UPI001D8FBEF1|nr:DUF2244 domain-containing protein [Paracoccaceae bacterium]MCC0065185.1 DUF2244 domain-containing protein [Defluviimonas sp.]
MPYEWIKGTEGGGELHLWPYRSLPRRGFVFFIGVSCALLAVPLFSMLGSSIVWALLPFMALAIAGVWWALSRSYRDGELIEILTLAPDEVVLVRRAPSGAERRWQANPYWVSVNLYPSRGPVPHYLTLRGNGREVELGAFLTEEERKTLAFELRRALGALKAGPSQDGADPPPGTR